MAFSCTALLLHQNNEKVAKAESDCQSASAVRDRMVTVSIWFAIMLSSVKIIAGI